MLEVYLFINPISETCYQTEKKIIKLLAQAQNKIRFRVLPLLTLSTVSFAMQHVGVSNSIEHQVVDTLYKASLDYEAALFQGQKRGRNFLLNVQECTLRNNFKYTDEMVEKVAFKSHLDWGLFKEDRQSDLAVKTFKKDQRIAAEMQITTYPEVVVTNTDFPDYAFSLNPQESFDILQKFILHPQDSVLCPNNHTQYLHSAKLSKPQKTVK